MHKLLIPVALFAIALPVLAQPTTKPLADLIQLGDRKTALAEIRAGANVNVSQPDGTTPVHWAVYQVDYEILEALLAKKAKVNVRNDFGSTPISEAAKLGDARLVKALLDAGAEPEGANEDGQTALMLAIKTGELPVVEMLLKAGAKVNIVEKFHNQTPLMWAVSAPKNAGAMTKLLLAKDANPKPRALYSDWDSQISSEPRAQYRPVGGLNALLYAVRDGCYECVESLIGAGADVNVPTPEGVSALMLALDNEHNDVAKLLLEKGANPHVWDWWGRTPLYIVIDRKEAAGAPARGGRAGATPARVAIASGRAQVPAMEIINMLLAADVDVNSELNMHRPSRGGNSGRFVDPLLSTGCTPLLRATMNSDMEVVKALLAKGALANVNDMGVTPFLVAAGVGPGGRGGTGLAAQAGANGNASTDLMNLLIEHGADVNAQVTGTKSYSMRISRGSSENEGMSALHIAAQSGRVDMVKYLLDHGANTELVNFDGKKPIDLVGGTGAGRAGAAPVAGGRGGGRGGPSPETLAQIKTLLQTAKK